MEINPQHLLTHVDNALKTYDGELAHFRLLELKKSLFKKFVPTASRANQLHDEAMDDFIARNHDIANFVVTDSYALDICKRVRNRICEHTLTGEFQTSSFTLTALLQEGRTGPGSSLGTKSTDFLGKMFASTLTTTSHTLYKHYRASLTGRWLEAEEIRLKNYSIQCVRGSKLGTVPKNADKNRTICTEPSLNMFYQLGAKVYFERALSRYFNVEIKRNVKGEAPQQEVNRLLAKVGSKDGKLSTLDLSNASDSWSLSLIKLILPEHISSVLDIIRSKYAEDPRNGEFHYLGMVSTMGNGFTFALMTYLFVLILDEFLRDSGCKFGKRYAAVYGDDIILPTQFALSFIGLLQHLGFSVNKDKSFYTGFFRESCGGDFYHGYPVRGVFIQKMKGESDVYSTFNRLCSWSINYHINIDSLLADILGLAKFRPVPLHASDHEGVKIPSFYTRGLKRDVNGSTRYSRLVPRQSSYPITDTYANPDAAVLAFVGGYVRGQRVTLRSIETRFSCKSTVTHNWDYCDSPGENHRDWGDLWLSLVLSCKVSPVASYF